MKHCEGALLFYLKQNNKVCNNVPMSNVYNPWERAADITSEPSLVIFPCLSPSRTVQMLLKQSPGHFKVNSI